MDKEFQDRIDNYLLNRMDDAEKTEFLYEVEQDNDKKEQLEFTQNVKDSICSREEKLRALAQFRQQYEEEREVPAMCIPDTDAVCYCQAPNVEEKPMRSKKKIWLWISGVAAVLVVGFFAIKLIFVYESSPQFDAAPMEKMRGGDEVFSPAPTDSTDNDTIKLNRDKDVTPNE